MCERINQNEIDMSQDAMNKKEILDRFSTMLPIPSNMDASLAPPGRQLLNFPGIMLNEDAEISHQVKQGIIELDLIYPGVKENVLWWDVIKGSAIKGYNLVTVNLSAVYRGGDKPLHAPYCLVMWENMTDPILAGRELLGVPKIYADIPDHQQIGGVWHSRASHFGNKIMDMSINGLTALPEESIDQMNRDGKEAAMFGWKHYRQRHCRPPRSGNTAWAGQHG